MMKRNLRLVATPRLMRCRTGALLSLAFVSLGVATTVWGQTTDAVKWDSELRLGKTQPIGMALNNADAIVADAKRRVHIVWHNAIDTGATTPTVELHYVRLLDHGAKAEDMRPLTRTAGRSSSAGISVGPGDTLDMVWRESEGREQSYVAHMRSKDGGETWSEIHRVSPFESIGCPAGYTDPKGDIHIVWQKEISPRNEKSFYATSTDGGKTWSEPMPIHNTDRELSSFPSIAGRHGRVLLVYRGGIRPQINVYFRALDLSTGEWTEPVMVSDGKLRAWDPTITIDDSGALHVVYQRANAPTPTFAPAEDDAGSIPPGAGKSPEGPGQKGKGLVAEGQKGKSKGFAKGAAKGGAKAGGPGAGGRVDPADPHIYYARSDDGGKTWLLSQLGVRNSRFARIEAAKGDWLTAFWEDGPSNLRTAGGDIWNPKEKKWIGNFNANTTDQDASFAQATLDDAGWLHVLWIDRRSGGPEIYYRRGRVLGMP